AWWPYTRRRTPTSRAGLPARLRARHHHRPEGDGKGAEDAGEDQDAGRAAVDRPADEREAGDEKHGKVGNDERTAVDAADGRAARHPVQHRKAQVRRADRLHEQHENARLRLPHVGEQCVGHEQHPGARHAETHRTDRQESSRTHAPRSWLLASAFIATQSTQSAMKTFVSPGVAELRFDAKTSFLPSGENIGKPSKSAAYVTRSRPV